MQIHFVQILLVDHIVEEAQQSAQRVAILVRQHLANDGQGFGLICGRESMTLIEQLDEFVAEQGLG